MVSLVVCAAMAALLLVATLMPLSRNPHWLVRGMDFPRLQLAVIAALLLVAETVLLDLSQPLTLALIGVTAFCLVWQMWWILPYAPVWPVEVMAATDDSPERALSILTANVLTPNRNADALLTLVRKHAPDVLVTLESDQWWQDRLDVLAEQMPHSIKCPMDNLYGMHVYSRLPLSEATVDYLVEDDVPSMHALLTLRNGVDVRVHFLHPAPPSPTENPESAERDAELVAVARRVASSDQPVVVTGDLNDVAWSATTRLFRKLSGLLDPRVGRGMYNTFHADYRLTRWPLDHLFHSNHFTLRSIERMPHIGSDHFALLTRLVFAPARGADQEGLEPEDDDLAWARTVTDAQDVETDDVPQPGEGNRGTAAQPESATSLILQDPDSESPVLPSATESYVISAPQSLSRRAALDLDAVPFSSAQVAAVVRARLAARSTRCSSASGHSAFQSTFGSLWPCNSDASGEPRRRCGPQLSTDPFCGPGRNVRSNAQRKKHS